MTRIAFYPGTFDPVTNGHVDILRGALEIADSVVVAIGINASKSPMFSLDERRAMLDGVVKGLGRQDALRVTAITFTGLAVAAAQKAGATLLIRGLRDGGDFDFEMQLAGMNAALTPGLRTVFLPSSPDVRHITATLVRQVAALGGDVSPFVPATVAKLIAKHKFR